MPDESISLTNARLSLSEKLLTRASIIGCSSGSVETGASSLMLKPLNKIESKQDIEKDTQTAFLG